MGRLYLAMAEGSAPAALGVVRERVASMYVRVDAMVMWPCCVAPSDQHGDAPAVGGLVATTLSVCWF